VFGTLLDRQAGYFRLGPFGANVPAARHYEPGTNTLVTTWEVRGGWVVVRDALTLGPRRAEDTITPHIGGNGDGAAALCGCAATSGALVMPRCCHRTAHRHHPHRMIQRRSPRLR
jgi:hypothetical protein